MHLRNYRVVRQIDYSQPQPAQKFQPEAFCSWLAKQGELAERVVVCYEAGCFGYEPARRMQATVSSRSRKFGPGREHRRQS